MKTSAANTWIRLLALYTVATLIESAFWGQMSSFTPLYLPVLGVAGGEVKFWSGIIVAASGLLGLPFLPLWGALADRYARKPVIIRSFVVYLFAGVLAVLAGNVWLFLLGRAIMSFSLGNSGLMMATLTERVPEGRRGLAFSIMNSASPIGVFTGSLVGGPIVDRFGFPTLLVINIVLLSLVVAALSFGYEDKFKGSARGSILRMMADSIGYIWHSSRLSILFPSLFMLFAGWMMALTYVPIAAVDLYHGNDPNSAIGVVMGVGGLLTLFLSPVVGAMADRHGHWKVLIAGSMLSVFLWPLPALVRELFTFTIAWAILNGLVSSVFALSFSVLSSSAEERYRGRVMSFAFLPVNVGYIIGPIAGSAITRHSTFAIFPAAAVFTAVGVVGLVMASRKGAG